jgi:hypothetical protein
MCFVDSLHHDMTLSQTRLRLDIGTSTMNATVVVMILVSAYGMWFVCLISKLILSQTSLKFS